MSRLKNALFAAIAVAIGLLFFLVAAELALRVLPVNEGMRAQPVNADHPVFRFEPGRTAIYAKGAAFNIVNKVRTNGAGFVSDQEYRAEDPTPLLALVGDSYVEALMVPYAETVQARLAQTVRDRGRVYAFAASGAGMAQYLSWARHARDTYHPQAMSVFIIPNDFAESMAWMGQSPGFHRFARRPDGGAELVLSDYAPTLARKLLRNSALAMYLITQAKIDTLLDLSVRGDSRYVGNVEALVSPEMLDNSRWVVDRFLDMLPEAAGLPPERLQLVVESVRPELYEPASLDGVRDSFWVVMRAYVIEQARARGMEAIDLNQSFMARYARDRKRFEFPTDGHWNGEGHAAAAAAIQDSRVFGEVFGK